jgi:tetratricopeptide (TPR) repeat protein
MGHHDFICFDDNEYIYENPHVSTGLSLANIGWAFTAYYSNNWHPVTWISHMIDCQLFGLDPGKHHMVNVVLHLVNVLLVFLLLRRMTGALWRSAFVAAAFAVNPMRVESIAWASERKDVLSTCLALLTIGAYASYARRPEALRYGAVLVLFALGIMAKPMLVTLPFLLLLLDVWPLRRFERAAAGRGVTISRLWLEKLPMLAIVVVSSILTLKAQASGGVVQTLEEVPLGMRVANALVSFVRYGAKLLVPLHQAFYYPYPDTVPVVPALGAAVVLAALTLVFWRLRRERPYAIVGWFWYLGTLVPVIGLVQVATQAIADRYAYIPSIGLFIVIAWGVGDLTRGERSRQVVVACLAAVGLLACAVKAHTQTAWWKDGVTLFGHDVQVVPNNVLAYRNLGVALYDRQRYAEAIPMFENVLKKYPHDAVSLFDIAGSYEKLTQYPQAERYYLESLAYKPEYAEAHYNLGNVYNKLGRPDEAIAQFDTTIRLKPEMFEAYNNLGNALSAKGDVARAIEQYREALRRNPDYVEAYTNLGSALRKSGKNDEALEQYTAALRINPQFAPAEYNMAIVYLELGDSANARRHFEAAARLDPELGKAAPLR